MAELAEFGSSSVQSKCVALGQDNPQKRQSHSLNGREQFDH